MYAKPKAVALVAIAAMSFHFGSCSSNVARNSKPRAIVPSKLVFVSVLFDGTEKMFTAFTDVNSDSKPDLLLGTSGHKFSDSEHKIQHFAEGWLSSHDLSVHFNQSTNKQIRFEGPQWPRKTGAEYAIPIG